MRGLQLLSSKGNDLSCSELPVHDQNSYVPSSSKKSSWNELIFEKTQTT